MDEVTLSRTSKAKLFAFYFSMVALAVVVFFLIDSAGRELVAPPAPSRQPVLGAPQNVSTLFQSLLALAVIIVTARVVGFAFSHIGQPSVIGEVVGGIMLGPSLLGRVAPEWQSQLLPAAVSPFLGVHAQLGVILYMFLVGLELDLAKVRVSGHSTIAISHASIVVPFVLGSALALALYPLMSSSDVRFTVFALFLGVSLSVTAFPVLARILTDRGMSRSRMGTIALTCAAVDDATAWCLLALVVSIAHMGAGDPLRTIASTLGFVLLLLVVLLPLVRRWLPRIERSPDLTRAHLTIVFVAMLASAMATEYIGIHAFFGAFLLGAIIPHKSRTALELNRRLSDVVAILFLPAFFALTGLRTEIGLVSGARSWLLVAIIVLFACLGKFGGTLVAARWSGFEWRDSAALGILMNTRGLVELIVLNVGLDLRIISPTLFTMLVIMAVVTTVMTTPILSLLLRKHPWVERTSVPSPDYSSAI